MVGGFWSPTGTQVSFAGWDSGRVYIWDLITDEVVLTYMGHQSDTIHPESPYPDFVAVIGGVWSPDSRHVVTGASSGWIHIWDAQTGQPQLVFQPAVQLTLPTFSPDGSRIATCTADSIGVWDAETGELLTSHEITDLSQGCGLAYWSPDGSKLAVSSDTKAVSIIDANSGELLYTFVDSSSLYTTANWISDNRVVSADALGKVEIWDPADGTIYSSFDTIVDCCFFMSPSPDASRVATTIGYGPLQDKVFVWPIWADTQSLIDYARRCCVLRDLTSEERSLFGLPPVEGGS